VPIIVVPSYSRPSYAMGNLSMNLEFNLRGLDVYGRTLYKYTPKKEFDNLTHYVIHHPEMKLVILHIFTTMNPKEPFFTDADKNILFFVLAVASK